MANKKKMLRNLILGLMISFIFISCNSKTEVKEIKPDTLEQITYVIYSPYSKNENKYFGFNSPKAINCIADVENEYFNNFDDSISRYYGTLWANAAYFDTSEVKGLSLFDEYVYELSKLSKDLLKVIFVYSYVQKLKIKFLYITTSYKFS